MQARPDKSSYYQEFVAQYIKDHTAAVNSAINVPVYYEEQLLYSMECFAIGQDAGLRAGTMMRQFLFEIMVTMFPDPVLRDIGNYIYLCYDTENGTRLYVFYSKEKDKCMFTDGFPVIMKKTLSWKDFAELKPGDLLEKVESIDQIVPLYMPTFDHFSDENLEYFDNHENWFQTIHLLTDGILRINYDKIDGEYVITSIIYREDFILDGLNGQTCYRIYEEDY